MNRHFFGVFIQTKPLPMASSVKIDYDIPCASMSWRMSTNILKAIYSHQMCLDLSME